MNKSEHCLISIHLTLTKPCRKKEDVPRHLDELIKSANTLLSVEIFHEQPFPYHEHIAIHILLDCFCQCARSGQSGQIIWTWLMFSCTQNLEFSAQNALSDFFSRFLSLESTNRTASVSKNFHYPNLPRREGAIRLLVLWPAASNSDGIKCQLAWENLRNNPDFEALSYVWGNPQDSRTIEVNGVPCPVTYNLEVALRHFRNRTAPRVLWVDALCINQNDAAEKSFQVQQMAKIYGEAREVLIWLGTESRTTATAYSAICATFLEMYGPMFELVPAEIHKSGRGSLEYQGSKFFSPNEVDALVKFFARPWFRRVWVVQEMVHAKEVTFHCGKFKLPSPTITCFRDVVSQVEVSGSYGDGGFSRNLLSAIMPSVAISAVAAEKEEGRPYSLRELLYNGMYQEATDPRDKVYARLSLITEEYSSLNDQQSLLEPNYSLPVLQVYINATRAIIQHEANLRVLPTFTDVGIEDCKRTYRFDLPSWVPDWSVGTLDQKWPRSLRYYGLPDESFMDKYNQSTGLDPVLSHQFSFSEDGRVLKAPGIQIDCISIADPSSYVKSIKDSSSIQAQGIDYYISTFLGSNSSCHLQSDVSKAFWDTVMADWLGIVIQKKEENPWIPKKELRKDRFDSISLDPPSDLCAERKLIEFIQAMAYTSPTVIGTFLEKMSPSPSRRRHMFRTSKGFFGRGPPQACQGDIIVALLGGEGFHILRKIFGFYQLVGQWYVTQMFPFFDKYQSNCRSFFLQSGYQRRPRRSDWSTTGWTVQSRELPHCVMLSRRSSKAELNSSGTLAAF